MIFIAKNNCGYLCDHNCHFVHGIHSSCKQFCVPCHALKTANMLYLLAKRVCRSQTRSLCRWHMFISLVVYSFIKNPVLDNSELIKNRIHSFFMRTVLEISPFQKHAFEKWKRLLKTRKNIHNYRGKNPQ